MSAVAAHATPGAELWLSRTGAARSSLDQVDGLAVSPDGSRVFVVGTVENSHAAKVEIVAHDASTGTTVWTSHYKGSGQFTDEAAGIAASPDGSLVFVAARTSAAVTRIDYITLAYDAATGVRVWKRRYSSSTLLTIDAPAAIGVSPDGSTVFVTGAGDGGPALTDYVTVAYDAATGQHRWTATYSRQSRDNARTLSVSPDGAMVFVSGFSVSNNGLDIVTVAYDAEIGRQVWTARYDGPTSRDDQPNAMAVSPDGTSVYVTGFSNGGPRRRGSRDFVTLAYRTSTGALRWAHRYNGPGDWNDNAKAITVSADASRLFVTGYRTGHHARDMETIAYSSKGARLWMRAFTTPGNTDDQPTAIGISPDGTQVYVTGFRRPTAFDRDYATLAYRASTGEHLWQAFYDAGSYDTSQALGVDPDGSSVFVSGLSGFDMVTAAYSTS
ncbi:MAG TPA: PQQ-binding-like beta-propeller repeat protein [Actinomycetota bacterium]|nr:PQQ-binding-like beta-propeller repeat protein [Actinomycetota bacterium]